MNARFTSLWWKQQALALAGSAGAGIGAYFLLLVAHAPGKGGFVWLAIMITAAVITRDLILDAQTPQKVDPSPSTGTASKGLRLICSHLVKQRRGDEMDRET